MTRIKLLRGEKKKKTGLLRLILGETKQHSTTLALGLSLFFSGMLYQYYNPVAQVWQSMRKAKADHYLLLRAAHHEEQGKKGRVSIEFCLTRPYTTNDKYGNDEKHGLRPFRLVEQEPSFFSLTTPRAQHSFTDYSHTLYLIKDKSGGEKPDILKTLNPEIGEYVLVINKETQKAQFYRLDYVLVDETDVSTGRNPGDKQRQGDHRTPEGVFRVISVENSKNWRHNGRLAYGPFFARLNCGSYDQQGNHNPQGRSTIGIHGTDEPEKLGLRASEGCVRLHSKVIQEYVSKGYLRKGVRVAIIPHNNYLPTTPLIPSTLSLSSGLTQNKEPLTNTSPNASHKKPSEKSKTSPAAHISLEGVIGRTEFKDMSREEYEEYEERYKNNMNSINSTCYGAANQKTKKRSNKTSSSYQPYSPVHSKDEIIRASQEMIDRINKLLYDTNPAKHTDKKKNKSEKKGGRGA